MDKAHVQHPVGLVQHENLQAVQIDKALVVEVHQPAGGGDQDVDAPFQGLHLGILAHSAEDDGGAEREVFPVGHEALLDLEGQLPGGGEDQGPDGTDTEVGLRLPAVELLEDGGGEGTGLAGACLGTAQHVPPGQGGGDGFFLNGGRLVIALLLQGAQNGGVQPQVFELH